METECGNHGRYYILKSISKKYIQDNQQWTRRHIERIIKNQIIEDQLPKHTYRYKVHYQNQEESINDNLINRFDDIIIINPKNNSTTTREFCVFQPLSGYSDYVFQFKEPLFPSVKSISHIIPHSFTQMSQSVRISNNVFHRIYICFGKHLQ